MSLLATALGAIATGLLNGLFGWLSNRDAEVNKAEVGTQAAYIAGKQDSDKAETDAREAGKIAHDTASSNFSTMQ